MHPPFGTRRLITATLAALLISFQFCIDDVHANLLASPVPKWSIQLQGSGRQSNRGLRKGNAIVAANDGTKIVATASDGSLHIIQTTNQVKSLAVYMPDEKDGRELECRSGANIVYKEQQDGLYYSTDDEGSKPIPATENFVIYAVVDRGSTTSSRIIAVTMEGKLKWSVEVPGQIEGTPVVGKTGIYVSHNDRGYGALSIIGIQRNDGMATIAATVTTLGEEQGLAIPFGPPSIQNYPEGDLVMIAENWDSGFSDSRGGLYILSSGSDGYQLEKISSWSYSASAPPLIYGESIFVGAAGGAIGGFTGDRRNDLSGIMSGREQEISPRWNYILSPNPENPAQPIRNQPVLDEDGEYLCVSGVDSDFYCLESRNGRELWRAEEGSEILARPHIFDGEDWEKVVYAIESENGRIRQYDLYSGRQYWDYSCADINNQVCQGAVEADFAITSSGNTIYYGDIYGRINSLEVANFETESPTIAPTLAPTITPSGNPTLTSAPTVDESPTTMPEAPQGGVIITNDDEMEQQSQQDDGDDTDGDDTDGSESSAIMGQEAAKEDSNKTALYIGAAIAGLCVLMIPIVILSMLRRRKKKTSSKDVVVEMIDDCSSDDVESQSDQDYLNSVQANDGYDPNSEDGIEVTIIDNFTPQGNQSKKKRKKKKGGPVSTPDTVNSLESIEEIPGDEAGANLGNENDTTANLSVGAVNLGKSFDMVADSHTAASRDNANDSGNFSDDDDPPPPPPSDEVPIPPASRDWSLGSLLKIGSSQNLKPNSSSKISIEKNSENCDTKSSQSISSSNEESSTAVSTKSKEDVSVDEQLQSQNESVLPQPKKKRWGRKNKKNPPSTSSELTNSLQENEMVDTPISVCESEKSENLSNDVVSDGGSIPEQTHLNDSKASEVEDNDGKEKPYVETESATSPPASPVSPSRSLTPPLGSAKSLSPVRSEISTNNSSIKSVGSDDESLYTSYTGTTGETPEKRKDDEDLSELANYVYDQYIHRRGRSELLNERKSYLSQPVLSESILGPYEEEHPADEVAVGPTNSFDSDEANGQKYGRSVRSKRESNSFKPINATEPEYSHTPLAQMYDQLAAIGQQRREEKKPAFKRRNKKMEREYTSPTPVQQEEQQEDTWGSFLNELAEAEQQFYSPSTSKNELPPEEEEDLNRSVETEPSANR